MIYFSQPYNCPSGCICIFFVAVQTQVVDRFSSNGKAERAIQRQDVSWGKHVQKCEIHIVSQSNSYAMNLLRDDVSGLLSLSLAQQGSGVLKTLRDILASVLDDYTEIYYENPPLGHTKHREDVFSLYLPIPETVRHVGKSTSQVLQRRYILSCMLNGDLQDTNKVAHYCVYGCCQDAEETRSKMVDFVCWALLPSKTPRFARNRWVNQEASVDWAGLLCAHHDLLSKLLIKWVGAPSSDSSASPTATATATGHADDLFGGYMPAIANADAIAAIEDVDAGQIAIAFQDQEPQETRVSR